MILPEGEGSEGLQTKFVPQELKSLQHDTDISPNLSDNQNKNSTELPESTKYRELMDHYKWNPAVKKEQGKRALFELLKHAFSITGSIVKPMQETVKPYEWGESGEFDLDLTLELTEWITSQNPGDLMLQSKIPKKFDVTVMLDTSLSMSGAKYSLCALSLAVLATHLDPENLSVVAFESGAHLIKPLGGQWKIEKTLLEFLNLENRGYTNIEAALSLGSKELNKSHLRQRVGLLITDGRYTVGKNPTYLAKKFKKLHVIQLGQDVDYRNICLNLAKLGGGKLFLANQMNDLPKTMSQAVHHLID